MRLSFTAKLALDLIERRKTDTYRKLDAPVPQVGDVAAVCVNSGRPDIASVTFTRVEVVAADDIEPNRLEEVRRLLGRHPQYRLLSFHLASVNLDALRAQNLTAFKNFFAGQTVSAG